MIDEVATLQAENAKLRHEAEVREDFKKRDQLRSDLKKENFALRHPTLTKVGGYIKTGLGNVATNLKEGAKQAGKVGPRINNKRPSAPRLSFGSKKSAFGKNPFASFGF